MSGQPPQPTHASWPLVIRRCHAWITVAGRQFLK